MPVAELCAGPVGLLDGRLAASDVSLTLRLEVGRVEDHVPSNTILVTFDDVPRRYRLCDLNGSIRGEGTTTLRACFGAMGVTAELRDQLARHVDPVELAAAAIQAPLFYASSAHGPGDDVYVHGQVRFAHEDALFVRTGAAPVARMGWVKEAVAHHAAQSTFLNNHQCYYRRCLKGTEAEYKYTLSGDADVWALTILMYRELARGELPGFIMEYRDEFQQWDYDNHLFEVLAPASERGYISFIPTTDGRHKIKRKWYVADALMRREETTGSLDLRGSMEDEIAARFGCEVRALPAFRRVRYDVNFESVRTGHVYGTFFDHCSLLEDSSVVLRQCEVEYLRTRSALPPAEETVLPELAVVNAWTREFLQRHRVEAREDFYSKLSFLRDVVAERMNGNAVR